MTATPRVHRPFGIDAQASTVARCARSPRIVSVASGKGGVGKTFISTSLALLAARTGQQVLLIDGDLALATVDIALGLRPRHDIVAVINERVSLNEAIVRGPDGVFVLAAGVGAAGLASLTINDQRRLLGALRTSLAPFDLVVIDCGAGVGDTVVFFGRTAQESVVVVTPEPPSIANAFATIKVLASSAGVATIDVIVNQAGQRMGREVFARLASAAGGLPTRLRYLGHVPVDDAVRAAVCHRRALVVSDPESLAARAVVAVGRSWLAHDGGGQAAFAAAG